MDIGYGLNIDGILYPTLSKLQVLYKMYVGNSQCTDCYRNNRANLQISALLILIALAPLQIMIALISLNTLPRAPEAKFLLRLTIRTLSLDC